MICLGLVLSHPESQRDSLLMLLPADSVLNGLAVQDDVRYFESSDISDFSPEMVQIYYEYGLIEMIRANYLYSANNEIISEIYHMDDSGGAYGLFSVSRMTGGNQAGYGDESYQSDRCVYFWKGNYYVRVYSDDTSREVIDVISRIASLIDASIESEGRWPEIIEFLPEEGFVMERTRYFRGGAGLSSGLPFGFDDIPGFIEGVYSDFGTYGLIVLKYESDESREVWFEKITGSLSNNKRYREVPDDDNYERFEDKDGSSVIFGNTGQYIMVFMGRDFTRQPEIFERIEDAMIFQDTQIEDYP